jgi:hypothetical protein
LNFSTFNKMPKLPSQILALPNPDKEFHEKWTKTRDKLNIPHPFRAVALGPPNCGKGCAAKNLIVRADPPFEEIIVIHCDPEYTQEWEDVDAEMMANIPAPEDWKGEVKTLVILDDLEFKQMGKTQKRNLDRLYGYVSTHKNVSVILCAQDAFNVPPIVRRCSNLWIMWRTPDLDAMACVSRKTGMKAQNFNSIFNHLMCDTHDSLWIDQTSKSPYPLRRNGYEIIKKVEGEETKKEDDKLDKFERI